MLLFATGKVFNVGNGQNFQFNALEIEKSEQKMRRNMKKRDENEYKESEGNMSRLDYELSSYGDLLVIAMKPIRGQVFL